MAQAILGAPNVVLVLGELAFAAVLFSGRQPVFSWWACIACFASFAIFAGYKVINGDSDCGCFGAVSPPPTAALGIDLAVLSVLCVVGKPGTSPVSVPCGAGFQCYFASMVRIMTMPFRLGVIVGIAVSCSASAADDFLDWTAAVQANEDHAAGVIGSFRIQSTNDFVRVSQTTREANAELGVNVDLPVIQIVEVDVRGRWMLQRRKNGKGTEFVTGQNSKYVFDIEKAAGGSSYTITRLEYRSADVTLDPDVSEYRFTIFPECYAFGENLKQLMLDPGFRFGKVSEVLGIDGKKLKRISFEYVPTTEARMQIENATIDCDAAQGWTIVGGKAISGSRLLRIMNSRTLVPRPKVSRK